MVPLERLKPTAPLSQSQALYHWLTLQLLYSYLVTVSPRGMRCPSLIQS